MNISYGVPIQAPQTTGHPASLPADMMQDTAARQVATVSEGADGFSFDLGLGKEQSVEAPPTAMQRKIMELLERQAKELEEH
ncbi:hypothetical protein [Albibacillus kandeliae]|uniref:hypothetical protein n=1 Tax=Albibacillus kandeliae TaxID=2174228 RepID=UPI000D696D8A|nr:hypothetical protein [Albibacillus kandeliae]